jgi:hypothetical protein
MEGLVHARYHLAKAEGSGEEGGDEVWSRRCDGSMDEQREIITNGFCELNGMDEY